MWKWVAISRSYSRPLIICSTLSRSAIFVWQANSDSEIPSFRCEGRRNEFSLCDVDGRGTYIDTLYWRLLFMSPSTHIFVELCVFSFFRISSLVLFFLWKFNIESSDVTRVVLTADNAYWRILWSEIIFTDSKYAKKCKVKIDRTDRITLNLTSCRI